MMEKQFHENIYRTSKSLDYSVAFCIGDEKIEKDSIKFSLSIVYISKLLYSDLQMNCEV